MDKGAWWTAVHGVAGSRTRLSDFTFTFHFLALEKEMATHICVLAWRIPGEPGGLLSMGSHRVGNDWSDLAAAEQIWQGDAHTHTHTLSLSLSLSLSIRGYVVIRVSCKCFWLFWQSWPKIRLCVTWLLLIMWIKLPDTFWNLKTFWHWKLEKKTNPFVSFHVNDEQPSGGNHEINAWNHSSMDTNNGLK